MEIFFFSNCLECGFHFLFLCWFIWSGLHLYYMFVLIYSIVMQSLSFLSIYLSTTCKNKHACTYVREDINLVYTVGYHPYALSLSLSPIMLSTTCKNRHACTYVRQYINLVYIVSSFSNAHLII